MRKIGILGGTFDPPHNGHLLIANEVLHTLGLEEVWFLPNAKPPHKSTSETSTIDRVTMLEKAISENACFKVEKLELERKGPSYTYDTMKLLQEKNDGIEFYFIIGADMVEYLPKWYKIDELLKLVTFVGVQRPAHQLQSNYPVIFIDIPEFAVSSSLIRERVKNGNTIHYLTPVSVIQYIKEHQLYGTSESARDC
jgi:nicotinate-nucleotide adenylyltransferase